MAKKQAGTNSIGRQLQELHIETEGFLHQNYERSLPFADGLFDRWERAKRLGFEHGASIYNSAYVYGAVMVGPHTWIGPNVILDGSGGVLRIGKYCSISAGVHIYTHDTVHWAISGGEIEKRVGSVTIGDNVFIGSQTIISHGVEIGSRCVITCNSYINKDVPDGMVFSGNPARRIGTVEGSGLQATIVYDR